MQKVFVFSGLAAGLMLAAMPAVAAPAAPMNWTGFYVGGTVGYGAGTWSGNLTKFCPTPPGTCTTADFDFAGNTHASTSGNGLLEGVQLGFANQQGGVVWGLEGDVSGAGVTGSGVFSTKDFGFLNAGNPHQVFYKHIQTNLDWLGTLRARFGVLVNPVTLLYGTGGLAVGGTSSHQDVYFDGGISPPGLHASGSADGTKWGWTIGAGLERQLGSHWSVKAEYLYSDLGQIDYHYIGMGTGYPYGGGASSHTTDGFSPHLTVQVARVGFNYRFGG